MLEDFVALSRTCSFATEHFVKFLFPPVVRQSRQELQQAATHLHHEEDKEDDQGDRHYVRRDHPQLADFVETMREGVRCHVLLRGRWLDETSFVVADILWFTKRRDAQLFRDRRIKELEELKRQSAMTTITGQDNKANNSRNGISTSSSSEPVAPGTKEANTTFCSSANCPSALDSSFFMVSTLQLEQQWRLGAVSKEDSCSPLLSVEEVEKGTTSTPPPPHSTTSVICHYFIENRVKWQFRARQGPMSSMHAFKKSARSGHRNLFWSHPDAEVTTSKDGRVVVKGYPGLAEFSDVSRSLAREREAERENQNKKNSFTTCAEGALDGANGETMPRATTRGEKENCKGSTHDQHKQQQGVSTIMKHQNKRRSRSTSCVTVRHKMQGFFTSLSSGLCDPPPHFGYETTWDRGHAIWLAQLLQLIRTHEEVTYEELYKNFVQKRFPQWRYRMLALTDQEPKRRTTSAYLEPEAQMNKNGRREDVGLRALTQRKTTRDSNYPGSSYASSSLGADEFDASESTTARSSSDSLTFVDEDVVEMTGHAAAPGSGLMETNSTLVQPPWDEERHSTGEHSRDVALHLGAGGHDDHKKKNTSIEEDEDADAKIRTYLNDRTKSVLTKLGDHCSSSHHVKNDKKYHAANPRSSCMGAEAGTADGSKATGPMNKFEVVAKTTASGPQFTVEQSSVKLEQQERVSTKSTTSRKKPPPPPKVKHMKRPAEEREYSLCWNALPGHEAELLMEKVWTAGAWLVQQKLIAQRNAGSENQYISQVPNLDATGRVYEVPLRYVGNTLEQYYQYLDSFILPTFRAALRYAGLSTAHMIHHVDEYGIDPRFLVDEDMREVLHGRTVVRGSSWSTSTDVAAANDIERNFMCDKNATAPSQHYAARSQEKTTQCEKKSSGAEPDHRPDQENHSHSSCNSCSACEFCRASSTTTNDVIKNGAKAEGKASVRSSTAGRTTTTRTPRTSSPRAARKKMLRPGVIILDCPFLVMRARICRHGERQRPPSIIHLGEFSRRTRTVSC
ncbi:unnamed protein product [Amoebophrya sp. A120]|nr:unnamed protein product [Amoebophrya sp. A120]|eukprot:GSA120T00017844001.1